MDEDSLDNLDIIADPKRGRSEFSVSEYVMRFDLSDATFLVFHSASGGDVSVAYQCPNGNISWNGTGSRAVGQTGGANAAVTD